MSAHVGFLLEKFCETFQDDILPWMFPVALWAYACHGKLSHLVVSFYFPYIVNKRRLSVQLKYLESCVYSPVVLSRAEHLDALMVPV